MHEPSTGGSRNLVLIVDDEREVRLLLQDLLARDGIRSIGAFSGEAALEVFHARSSEIGFVILDLTMPGMGGLETLKGLRGIDPAVPVVLCSGALENDLAGGVEELGIEGFLAKPFELRRLRETSRRLLARLA